MSFPSTLIPISKVFGLTGSALLSGLIGAMSYVSIPALNPLPPVLAAQVWKRTYDIGVGTAPPLAVSCSLCFAGLAWTASAPLDSVNGRSLYAAAAVLLTGIVPFTLATMVGINNKLMAKARDGEKAAVSDAETKALLKQWGRLNFGRMVLVLTGSVLGCVATVARV